MDDLIPFLIFVAVALINLIKTAIERGGAKSAPRPAPRKATPPPQQTPTILEDFFEDIAEQFGRAEEKEEDFSEAQEPVQVAQEVPPYEPTPTPIVPLPFKKASAADLAIMHKKAIGTAMKSMPNTLLSLDAMKLPSIPLLSSTQKGVLDFPLQNRKTFKNAIIANIIFSPPRAYDPEYKNTNLS
jgi:hypothetical protein